MYRSAGRPPTVTVLAMAMSLIVVAPSSARAAEGDAGPTVLSPSSAEAPPAPTGKPTPPPDPPAIHQLRARGLEVKAAGILGHDVRFWLVRDKGGRLALVATTAEGFLIRGKIYAPDGTLNLDTEGNPPLFLKEDEGRQHGLSWLTGLPKTAATDFKWQTPQSRSDSKASAFKGTVWDQLGHATVVEEGGAGAPLVYIFIDPYCPYCHQQWQTLREKVRLGTLRVRWVPVAVLAESQSNPGVVGGLLTNPTAETLAGWMRDRRVRPDVSEVAKRAMAPNMVLFQALKIPSVPALIYKDRAGKLITRAGVSDL